MKKLFFVLCFVFFVGPLNAQIERTMSAGKYADTLKSTKKTINITPDAFVNTKMTVTVVTSSGIDTVYVKTYSRDGVRLSTKSLIDLSTGSIAPYMIATTTPREYLIYDPLVFKFNLSTVYGLVITFFSVSRK